MLLCIIMEYLHLKDCYDNFYIMTTNNSSATLADRRSLNVCNKTARIPDYRHTATKKINIGTFKETGTINAPDHPLER